MKRIHEEEAYVRNYGYKDTLTVYIESNETVISITPPSYYNHSYSYTTYNGQDYKIRIISIMNVPLTTNSDMLIIKKK